MLLGTKKKAGWFEIQDGRKLRLKSLAEAKPALVASQQQPAVADSESLENESRSVVADQESLRCQNCQRQFSTVTDAKCTKQDSAKPVCQRMSSTSQVRATRGEPYL